MRGSRACLVLLAASAVASPARADEKALAAATDAAVEWLALVDGGRYEESWEQAAALFRKAVTKEQWRQSLAGVREPLGERISRRLHSRKYATSLPGAPDGEYVVIEFEASFAHKKDAVETITPMREADGTWRVSGYYIR